VFPFRRRSYSESLMARRRIRRTILHVLLAFVAAAVFRSVFVDSWIIGSASMAPTLLKGDRVASSALLLGPVTPFGKLPAIAVPKRGSLVVVEPPFLEEPAALPRIADAFVRFFTLQLVSPIGRKQSDLLPGISVKRIVGVPGDTLRMRDWVFEIKPAGSDHFLTEFEVSGKLYEITIPVGLPGLRADLPGSGMMAERTLASGEFFVAGDGRGSAADSLLWGPLRSVDMIGAVFLRYWPLSRMSLP
jgi:signal peptidase I